MKHSNRYGQASVGDATFCPAAEKAQNQPLLTVRMKGARRPDGSFHEHTLRVTPTTLKRLHSVESVITL